MNYKGKDNLPSNDASNISETKQIINLDNDLFVKLKLASCEYLLEISANSRT